MVSISYVCNSAVKPAVQLLQIQEVHLGPHSNACNFLPFLSILLPVLSRSSFTSRTPNKDQKIEQLFSFKSQNPEISMSSAVNVFVHAIRKCSQKVPRIRSGSSYVALQYETGAKFFHRAVPELHDIKKSGISAQPHGVSVRFLHVCEVSGNFCWKYQADECSLYQTKVLEQHTLCKSHPKGESPSFMEFLTV